MEKPTVKEKAKELRRLFYKNKDSRALTHQKLIINKLKYYGIVSEYEQEVLNELKK